MKPQIDISVKTQYLDAQSDVTSERFVFAYTITISNFLTEPIQLISRRWIISDKFNSTQEVKGLGVVGQQPIIESGKSFTYTSSAVIATDTGHMSGSYQMRKDTGEEIDVAIPDFALIHPKPLH